MHEFSLMKNLLDVVARTAEREGGGPVRTIHLRIGELSGVNESSLRFAFDVLSKGTVAEDGTLEYEIVPLAARCRNCGEEFKPRDLVFFCPSCGGAEIEVETGREMEVDYIYMDDAEDRAEGSRSSQDLERKR